MNPRKAFEQVIKLGGEDKEAKWSKKFHQLTYWTSHNTETMIECSDFSKAEKIVEKSKVPQKLKRVASMNPRKAFEKVLAKQAVAAMNKDWTLSRRMDELYADFLQQVKWELVKMEPEVANKVKLHWEPRGHGFMWLGADFIAADGKRQEVTFLPETPFQAAGEILYKHGGY